MIRFIKDKIITTPEEVNKKYPNSKFVLGNCKIVNGDVEGELLCVGDGKSADDVHAYYQDLINEVNSDSKKYINIALHNYIFPYDSSKFISIDAKIDTGSNLTVISGELLSNTLKLEAQENPSDYIAISASGNKIILYELNVNILMIGQEGLRKQNIYVNFDWKDTKKDKVLLGMDLWGYFEAYFSYKDKKLYYVLWENAVNDIGKKYILTKNEINELTGVNSNLSM